MSASSEAEVACSLKPKWAAIRGRVVVDGRAEDQTDDGGELHDDVQCRPRRVLQRITNSVASHGVLVRLGTLSDVRSKASVRDIFLGVIPSTARVAHRDCQLHA